MRDTFRKFPTIENKDIYTNFRNSYDRILRISKQLYYQNQLEENQNNIKKTWQILHEITKKCNDKSSVVEEIKVGDQSITDHAHIAESFNSVFSTIGNTIADQIATTTKTASQMNLP